MWDNNIYIISFLFSVKTCKEKWKNLRTVFRRNLLKDGSNTKRPYYLNEHMQFMIPLLNGPKTRGRSWFQYQKIEDIADEVEQESSQFDDTSYGDEEEEEELMYHEDGASEDPLEMVETVINRDSPIGSKKNANDEHGREKKTEEKSSGKVKLEPEVEIKTESTSVRKVESHWLGSRAVTLLKYSSEDSRKSVEGDGRKRLDLRHAEEDRRSHFYDTEDSRLFEQPKKKSKSAHEESRSDVQSYADSSRPHTHCFDCPDTQFLLSLKPDLEQMTPKQKRRFKKEIFHLLDTILEDREVDYRHMPHLPSSTSRYGQKK